MMSIFSPHNTARSPTDAYLTQITDQILSAAMAQLVVPNDEEVAPPGLALFLKLPNEILHQINSYLDPVCLAVLSVTCSVCHLRADPIILFRLNIADLIYRRSV
jgi:hypothetical protein